MVLLLKMVTRSSLPFPCRAFTSQNVRSSHRLSAVQLLHLIDRGRMGPEPIAPVNQHDRLGDALEVDRPVEGRVAAADQQHPLTLELPRVEHLEVEPRLLVVLLALDPELPGLEGSDAGRDDDGPGRIVVVTSSPARSDSSSPFSTRRSPVTISPRWVVAPNCSPCVAMSRTRSLARTFGKPATSKMYFSGYSAISCPPSAGKASMIRAEAPRMPA